MIFMFVVGILWLGNLGLLREGLGLLGEYDYYIF